MRAWLLLGFFVGACDVVTGDQGGSDMPAADMASSGPDTTGDMAVASLPDLAVPPSGNLPFTVDSVFISSGYMCDGKDVVLVPGKPGDPTDCNGQRASASAVGKCHTITYTPAGTNKWAGVYWQYPANNWGTSPGYLIPSGATKVSFQAKGVAGGEKVKFIVGGIATGMPHGDTVGATQVFTLTKNWAQYSISIGGQSYASGVIGGFGWAMAATDAGAAANFSVDDIKWE
jgi:hypothetical protein